MHRHSAPRTCNSWIAASRNAKLSCAPPVASKQPRSRLSCSTVSYQCLACGLEQSMFDEPIDQWRARHQACVHAKEDILSTACQLSMLILSTSVTFNVPCLTVISLITKSYIFLFILQGSALTNFRYGGRFYDTRCHS